MAPTTNCWPRAVPTGLYKIQHDERTIERASRGADEARVLHPGVGEVRHAPPEPDRGRHRGRDPHRLRHQSRHRQETADAGERSPGDRDGQGSRPEAIAAYGLYPDPKVQAYVERLGKGLAAKSERPDLPWSFKVVDDPTVNAFALPGGYIYVTRGIMAHLRSEAELVAVLGHEIGHVTGRHSASQMSKQQLAMGGLIVGMAVKPELQRFGELAQQGLGLLFLKFGRDDENQADELGLRYMARQDYDRREMLEVFSVLDGVTRAEGGGARMPDWLSTHPSPGNRTTRIQGQIAATGADGTIVNRREYLRQLDGMVFGDNPSEGFFQENAFYHPDLRFQLAFPRGFKTQNQKQAVVGVSEAQDAILALTLAAGLLRKRRRASSSTAGRPGGPLWPRHDRRAPGLHGALRGRHRAGRFAARSRSCPTTGKIYRILGYTPAELFTRYQNAFATTLHSFGRLTDSRYLDVQPKRIALVSPEHPMELPEFARAYPSTVNLETIGLINGVAASQTFPRGELAKRVVEAGCRSSRFACGLREPPIWRLRPEWVGQNGKPSARRRPAPRSRAVQGAAPPAPAPRPG